ncbi:YfcL family protein [Erwiniaceae bacterium CAU 1747]
MIDEFEARILGLIDDMVEHASDDELFASGYLRGHLTAAVAEIELSGDPTPDALQARMQQSLENTIQSELSPRDRALVIGMWENLFRQASQLA